MATAMVSLLTKSIRKIIICLLWSLLAVGVSGSLLFASSCRGMCNIKRIILGRIILVRLMTGRFGWIWGCKRMMRCPMSVSMSISVCVLQCAFSLFLYIWSKIIRKVIRDYYKNFVLFYVINSIIIKNNNDHIIPIRIYLFY